MKRYEVLGKALTEFEQMEYQEQDTVADYINCPSVDECEYDGNDNSCCTDCKIKWLRGEWENE